MKVEVRVISAAAAEGWLRLRLRLISYRDLDYSGYQKIRI